MKLRFDQNLSPHLVRLLSDLFPESNHVSFAGLERATDDEIWGYAQANDYVIVTKDADFADLAVIRGRSASMSARNACTRTGSMARQDTTNQQLIEWFDSLSNWGRWGNDELMGRSPRHYFLPWLRERDIALPACDTANDPMPEEADHMVRPVHCIGIPGIGLWLLDGADYEELSTHCARLNRWEFMFVISPLKLNGASTSPVNPTAIL